MNALTKAITIIGSQAELARNLGIEPMAVSHWKERGIPPKWCAKVSELTENKVTVHELRPDIFGPAPDKAA